MADFLAMGGYAQYVWPAYAISALAVGGLVFATWRRTRALQSQIRALEAEPRAAAGAETPTEKRAAAGADASRHADQ